MKSKARSILTVIASPLWVLALPILVFASQVTIPNTFVSGTVADAGQVNANFTAVKNAVNDNDTRITAIETARTRVFASNDSNASGNAETAVAQKLMNTVAFTAPTAGFVVISGSVFINPTTVAEYSLVPALDAVGLSPQGSAARFTATSAGSQFTLSYTIVAAVTAGAHTVTQNAGPDAAGNWFHNSERLSVLFVSNGSIATQPSPLIMDPPNLSPNGD